MATTEPAAPHEVLDCWFDGAPDDPATAGKKVAHAHLHHLNPMPRNTGDVLRRFARVLVPELNNGQLVRLLRAEYLVDAKSYTKIQGLPFRAGEIETEILKRL